VNKPSKRNFQVMPGAKWLAWLYEHISDRYEHMVRYMGWYSNRARRGRVKKVYHLSAPIAPLRTPRRGAIGAG
jgi:hypothetical protein